MARGVGPGRIQARIDSKDGILKRFDNQLKSLGEAKGRQAMARAVNHTARKTSTAVKRALVKQTSAPRAIVQSTVKLRLAAHRGGGAIEAMIHATGSELPLHLFSARQFRYGVRAKVWGKNQRFPSMFGAAGDNPKTVAALGGQVFVRSGKSRLPIEKAFGPSIPKEMVIGETRDTFERESRAGLEERLRHEISRLLG